MTDEIACSLDAGSLAERVREWHELLATSVESVEVDDEAGGPRWVRLGLRPSDEALVSAASLGQREKQCCAFFDVAIALDAGRRSLVLAVPPGAEEALAGFADLLTS